jgi:heme-degrading monooxygenase HmoA
MIARTWAGATRAADADAYLDYLHATGLAEYRATPGNRGVLALRRIAGDRAEFLLVTLWDSEEAIRRFAGEDMDRAVFYSEDERYLIARDERVRHYEVVFQGDGALP